MLTLNSQAETINAPIRKDKSFVPSKSKPVGYEETTDISDGKGTLIIGLPIRQLMTTTGIKLHLLIGMEPIKTENQLLTVSTFINPIPLISRDAPNDVFEVNLRAKDYS